MPRALDHLVIAARDLGTLAERYRRLGLQVGPRNRHPWGTENHIVQFDGVFLELIALGEDFHEPAPDDPVAPFAGFLAGFLSRREGLAMMVLRSDDAEADRRAFAQGEIGDLPRFDFARKGMRGGREVNVAFSLAFAVSPALPEAGFFVCQQRFPENFWDAAAQVHACGAVGVAELALAHSQPEKAASFLEAYLGAPARPTPNGLKFVLDNTIVTCATPAAWAATLGSEPAPGFAALRIAQGDGSSFWAS